MLALFQIPAPGGRGRGADTCSKVDYPLPCCRQAGGESLIDRVGVGALLAEATQSS